MKPVIVTGFLLLVATSGCAFSVKILAEQLLTDSAHFQRIKVLGHQYDSIMWVCDLNTKDTIKVGTTQWLWKSMDKSNTKDSLSWLYSLPEEGEEIIMLKLGSHAIYARKVGKYYRFWDPDAIYYGLTFIFPKNSYYKPPEACGARENHLNKNLWECMDGFLIEAKVFEKYLD